MRRDHSNAFQGALHRMRDRGFFENVGVGDYMATPRTFEWVEHHYGTLPQAWMPVPKEQFHWRAVGAVDNVEFELRYVRGEMSEALVGGTAFSSAVEARTALMREGVWQRAEMPSWNDAMAAFEARASGCGTWQARG